MVFEASGMWLQSFKKWIRNKATKYNFDVKFIVEHNMLIMNILSVGEYKIAFFRLFVLSLEKKKSRSSIRTIITRRSKAVFYKFKQQTIFFKIWQMNCSILKIIFE